MSVLDIAATEVVTTGRTETLSGVASTMDDESVGSVVVEEDDLPIGILTDREVALALADDPEAGHDTVDDHMTRAVETVSADADVYEATRTLSEAGVRRAPIVDDDGHLTGLVSLDDVLHFVEEALDEAEDVIEAQSPRLE
ncbi:CBS domain-containing protein [Haloplanus sp. C73]|uniref:CBS domain-containing protein n=1 Tax=Haloplanus sp. C73 TaxID=3421641 RepID=UPI003EC04402